MISRTSALGMALAVALPAAAAQAQTEIQWWHAMTGGNLERVNAVAEQFNSLQKDYKIVPSLKGNYDETLAAGIAAFRAGKPPHILQVFDAGTGTMMYSGKAIKPIYEIFSDAGMKFDPKVYIPAITGYYSLPDGRMLSFPFNSSSPILYWNKDIFKKAGLDPEKPPKTYPELFEMAKKIHASGHTCGFTSTWATWIGLENFSAWHDVPFATKKNGMDGLDAELKFNTPLHVKHFQNLADLQKDKTFDYGGRTSEAKQKFTSGECAMLTESSGGLGDVRKAGFAFGTSTLPYYPEAKGAPQNTVPGGASLWVMAGHKKEDYIGVAKFFSYLSNPSVQAELHQKSGYLPITPAAYELTKQSGFYKDNPGTETPLLQMTGKPPTDNSKAVRLGNLPQVRNAINEEVEALFAGKQTAQQALDKAVERGNAILRQFEKDNK